MKNIAVIGAGTMGNGIAHVFAQCGYKVNLIDVSTPALEKGLATITKNLDRQVAKEKISVSDKDAALEKYFVGFEFKRWGKRNRFSY